MTIQMPAAPIPSKTKTKVIGKSVTSVVANRKRAEVTIFVQKPVLISIYDEQLQFTNADDVVFSNINYILSLADGTTATGVTDDMGRTKRIRTPVPVQITTAKLVADAPVAPYLPSRAPSVQQQHSCSIHPASQPEFLVMELNGIKTNSVEVGKSLIPVKTPRNESRPLTPGEITIATEMYADAVDYTKVKVHNGYFSRLIQGKNTAMAPAGEIYFPPGRYKEDFSKGTGLERHWFIHEMAHVWQYQNGYSVVGRALKFWKGSSYRYVLEPEKMLRDYNMEAQGDLLADYWSLMDGKKRGLKDKDIYMERREYIGSREIFEQVLRSFFLIRSSSVNLPTQ